MTRNSFVDEYLAYRGFSALRPLQRQACCSITSGHSHVLLAAPTSYGKTEAAFLPVVSRLEAGCLGAVYIAPLRALINDQFLRIQDMLALRGMRLGRWHGDISRMEREGYLNNPPEVLQITPESLHRLLHNEPWLFKDCKYFIIDEAHSFIDGMRGLQILSIMEQVEGLCSCPPLRIGLSATLGHMGAALEWLALGSKLPAICHEEREGKGHEISIDYLDRDELYGRIASLVADKRALVFHNSREGAEEGAGRLNGNCFVHHGRIDKVLRHEIEHFAKTSGEPWVVCATSTLELGIDIGSIDIVLQVDAPPSISAMVQRMGRGGRRGGVSPFYCIVPKVRQYNMRQFYRGISWPLVKAIAQAALFLQGHMERQRRPKKCYNLLLWHILAMAAIKPTSTADISNLLNLAIFDDIDHDELELLLRHMLNIGLLTEVNAGMVALGDKGHSIAESPDFFTMFNDNEAGHVHEIDDKTAKAMLTVLTSNDDYPFLSDGAKAALKDMRLLSRKLKANQSCHILPLSDSSAVIFPWLGTRGVEALRLRLTHAGLDVTKPMREGIVLEVHNTDKGIDEIKDIIKLSVKITDELDMPHIEQKFAKLIPQKLLKKQYISNILADYI